MLQTRIFYIELSQRKVIEIFTIYKEILKKIFQGRAAQKYGDISKHFRPLKKKKKNDTKINTIFMI